MSPSPPLHHPPWSIDSPSSRTAQLSAWDLVNITGGRLVLWWSDPDTVCSTSIAGGEVSAEEEGFENLSAMASTFIVLFLLSLFYSTTVTLFKVK